MNLKKENVVFVHCKLKRQKITKKVSIQFTTVFACVGYPVSMNKITYCGRLPEIRRHYRK